MSGGHRHDPGDRLAEPHGRSFARGCLAVLVLYAVGGAILVAVVWVWPGPGSREEPSPGPRTTIAPSYTRAPATFPPVIDEVLRAAWNNGRHGCAEPTSLAVDDLAAALERDIAEAPPLDARIVASQWVREECLGR